MILFKKKTIILLLIFLSSCSSIPKNTQNSCAIFEERYLWYKHSKASYEKWGAPIHLQLAFVKKEIHKEKDISTDVFSVYCADGTLLAAFDSKESAIAAILQSGLEHINLH